MIFVTSSALTPPEAPAAMHLLLLSQRPRVKCSVLPTTSTALVQLGGVTQSAN